MDAVCSPEVAEDLIVRMHRIKEPYRQNLIDWMQSCAGWRFTDLERDVPDFLDTLNPSVRDEYLLNLSMILDDAVRFFGTQPALS